MFSAFLAHNLFDRDISTKSESNILFQAPSGVRTGGLGPLCCLSNNEFFYKLFLFTTAVSVGVNPNPQVKGHPIRKNGSIKKICTEMPYVPLKVPFS